MMRVEETTEYALIVSGQWLVEFEPAYFDTVRRAKRYSVPTITSGNRLHASAARRSHDAGCQRTVQFHNLHAAPSLAHQCRASPRPDCYTRL